MSNEQKPYVAITRDQLQQLAAAYTRLIELKEAKIQTPTTAAEVKGLLEHLSATFIQFAPDFIGCWYVVRDEYEPALSLLARMGARVAHIQMNTARQAAAQQAPPTPAAEEPSNIVTIGK